MRLNVKLLAGTVAAVILFVLGGYFLHAFQVRRNASSIKERAHDERKAGRLEQAALLLGQFVGMVPDDTEAIIEYADLRSELGPTSPNNQYKVLELYEKALRLAPERGDIRRKAIATAVFLRRWGDAQTHIKVLEDGNAADGKVIYWRGVCEEGMGDHDKAAESLEKAYDNKKDPTLVDSYRLRVYILQARLDQTSDPEKQEIMEKIDKTIKRLLEKNPESPEAHVALLKHYMGFPPADPKQASEWEDLRASAVENALKYAGDDASVLLLAAAWQARENQPDKQRELLQKGVRLYPKSLPFYEALSSLELTKGDKENAAKWMREFLRNVPDEKANAEARFQLGEVLVQSGKTDEAQELSNQLRRDATAAVLANLLDAHILVAKLKPEWRQAARLLEQSHAQLAVLPKQKACSAELLLASCYEHLGEQDLRLAACRRATNADPARADAQIALAVALADSGRATDAVVEFQRLLKNKDHPLSADIQGKLEQNLVRVLILQTLQQPKAKRGASWKEIESHLARRKRSCAIPRSIPFSAPISWLRRTDPRTLGKP